METEKSICHAICKNISYAGGKGSPQGADAGRSYSVPQIEAAVQNGTLYGDFFRDAPQLNPDRVLIKGSICGVKLESIEELLMKEIRYLDKLVDELAKGKAMEKIKRTNK